MKRIMLIAGETSGDLLAAELVTELKNLVGEPLTWAVDKQIYAH